MTQQVTIPLEAFSSGNIPLTERACAAKALGQSVLCVPAYSRGDFVPTLAGGVFTYSTAPRRFFSYGIDGIVAGSVPDLQATLADTNLQVGSQAPNNWNWELWGLGLFVLPGSNPFVVGELVRECDLVLSLSNTTIWKLGPIDLYPAPGGLFGWQHDQNSEPDSLSALGAPISFIQLGRPDHDNYRHWNPEYIWCAAGSPNSDTQLVVEMTPRRAIAITQGTTRAAVAVIPGVTSVGQPAWTPPQSAQQMKGLFRMAIIARSVGPRSANV